MAAFTMYLHEVLGVDNPSHADGAVIGLDDYPIWDQGYRATLNQKIVNRFWNREIGCETVSVFRHNMRTLMHEIMPYYSELAKTTVWDFDPFETLNITTESEAETDVETTGTTTTDTEGTTTTEQETSGSTQTEQESSSTESGESTQTTKADNSSRSVNSDHPQTRLNEYEDYATSSADAVSSSVSESDGTSSGSQQSSVTGQDTTTGNLSGQDETKGTQHGVTDGEQRNRHRDKQTQRGTQGNKAQMLQQYRDTIVGVDVLILEELEVLFMGVWDTDQSYTRIESPYAYHRLLF